MTLPPPRNPRGLYVVSLVCLGNICRSPMAAVVLRRRLTEARLLDRYVAVDSAGLGDWHIGQPMDPRARATLADAGYAGPDEAGHRGRQFARGWFADRDLVLAMDRSNLAALERMAPEEATTAGRVRLFGSFGDVGAIPDPYHGGPEGFAHVLDLVEHSAAVLTEELGVLVGGEPSGPTRTYNLEQH